MIGHDRTGVGFIPVPLLNADLNGFGHETCDASILQPKGTARVSLQSPIRGGERLTGSAQRSVVTHPLCHRQRSPQSPCNEDPHLIGLPVRQSPAVVEHHLAGETARPTNVVEERQFSHKKCYLAFPSAYLFRMTMSTRRFLARPSGVSLDASGDVSAKPTMACAGGLC